MEFLKSLENTNIFIIQLIFFINFIAVFLLSYPLGRLVLKKNSKNLLFCSIISTSTFGILIAILVNFFAILAKYILIIFFLINFIIFIFKKKIYLEFKEQLKNDLVKIVTIPVVYFLILYFFYPIDLKENLINIPYDLHLIYYFSPIQEIINADYFSRIRIPSMYPMEWASFYFFQASFNSIYLNFFSSFGYLSLLFLKAFFFSLFFIDLIFFLKNRINMKRYSIYHIFIIFFYLNIFFYFFFVSNLNWSMFGNQTIVIFALYFIFKNLFVKDKNNLVLSNLLLIFGSFKNLILSFFFILNIFIKNLNKKFLSDLKGIKFDKISIFFILLYFLYFVVTFISSENVWGKFHFLGDLSMWRPTFTFKIINNLLIFFSLIILLFLINLNLKKKFKLLVNSLFEIKNVIILFLALIFPFIAVLILGLKAPLIELSFSEKIEIYLNSFTLENLNFYFLVPLLWIFISLNLDYILKLTILLTITVYTILSTFLHNHITLPAIYILEIFFVFCLAYVFIRGKLDIKNKLSIIVIILFINSTYFLSKNKVDNYILINLMDLNNYKNKSYLCPSDIEFVKKPKNIIMSDLLSGLLNKRFYSDLAYDKNYNFHENYHLAVPMAVPSKKKFNNPCKNK